MILTSQDPARMDTQDRLREIGTLLARGYLRSLSQKDLDGVAEDEAPWDHLVNGEEDVESTEVT